MSTLYTITANLLAETTAWYDQAEWGSTRRATRETFQVGGKGINVTRMAVRLDRHSEAYCFPAGRTGERCVEWMRSQGWPLRTFATPGESRSGWVVRVEGQPETTFLGMDRPVHPGSWQSALADLLSRLQPGDAVCLCGSVPGWGPELLEMWDRFTTQVGKDVLIAVDTYGPVLREIIPLPISLVKINRHEWQGLVGGSRELNASSLRAVGKRYPTRQWVVTDGPNPIWALNRRGQVFSVQPPAVDEICPTGSGDVLLAVLMHGLLNGLPLQEALLNAVPWSTANAASANLAEMKETDLPKLAANALLQH